MDIKIEKGDILLDESGNPITVQGVEEILQQIIIGTKIPKGSFLYNRNCGINTADLDFNSDKILKTLEVLMNEMFVGSKGVFVKAENIKNEEGKYIIQIAVTYGKNEIHREVIIDG